MAKNEKHFFRRRKKMTETNENVAVVDGPKNVRVKSDKKGPGKKIGIFANKTEAEKVQADLKTKGTEVVITEYEPATIVTYDEWKAGNEAETKKTSALKALESKFTKEEIADLKAAGLLK